MRLDYALMMGGEIGRRGGLHLGSELLRRDFREGTKNSRRAACSVLVEVEANLVKAAFSRGFVGASVENGLANG